MASKSGQHDHALSTKEIEDLLDVVDQALDRLKTLYEQYFLGIQKQAPSYIHSDVERKLRDLTQLNVRNTRLRYRLATIQQKFGSYNAYWRRTLRQIENGTYIRNLAKIGREAAKNGSDIPEEILAAMPKRMREQVLRDRDQAIAIAKRRNQVEEGDVDDTTPIEREDDAAMISEPAAVRRDVKSQSGAHLLSDDDDDLDFDSLFAAFHDDAPSPSRKPEPSSQEITMPVPRIRPGAETAPAAAAPPSAQPARTPTPTTQPTGSPDAPARTPAPATTQPTRSPDAPARTPAPATTQPIRSPDAPARTPAAATTQPTMAIPRFGPPAARTTGPAATVTPSEASRQTGPVPIVTPATATGAIPRIPGIPSIPGPQTTAIPLIPVPPSQQSRPDPIAPGSAAATGPVPVESMAGPENPAQTQGLPKPVAPTQVLPKAAAPTQVLPKPVSPPGVQAPGTGARPPSPPPGPRPTPSAGTPPTGPRPTPSAGTPPTATPSAGTPPAGPRPTPSAGTPTGSRPTPSAGVKPPPGGPPRPGAAAPQKPPPGMTEADVNALHAKYVEAKQKVGEKVDASSREKLLRTINQTAPKIMEQYKASGVDFSVVVKDNQVVIKAKPKT